MSYYVLDKISNRVYGPMETKYIADETIKVQFEGLKAALRVEVKMVDVLDEHKVYIDGKHMATYEVIDESQVTVDQLDALKEQ